MRLEFKFRITNNQKKNDQISSQLAGFNFQLD